MVDVPEALFWATLERCARGRGGFAVDAALPIPELLLEFGLVEFVEGGRLAATERGRKMLAFKPER